MQIKAIRPFRNDLGTVRRGAVVDLAENHARSLIKRGLAEAVEEAGEKPAKRPKPHHPAKAKAKASSKGD